MQSCLSVQPRRCYNNPAACANGPNACNAGQPCQVNPTACGTGQAGGLNHAGASYKYFCDFDQPNASVQNGAGTLCYNSKVRLCCLPILYMPLLLRSSDCVPLRHGIAATT